MAKYTGKDGYVTVGGAEVGERMEFSLDEQVREFDATSQGNKYTAFLQGQIELTGSMTVFYDPADTGQDAMLLDASVDLVLYPLGNDSGNPRITGTFIITGRTLAVSVADSIKRTYTIRTQSDPVFDSVP